MNVLNESPEPAPAQPFPEAMLQALAGKPPPRQAPPEASNDGDEGSSAKANRLLRVVMGARLITARNLSGLGQSEAALMLGYGNSTQLSLIERAERLAPHCVLLRACEIYGVGLAFIYGTAVDPDIDGHASARNAEVTRIRGLLEANARAVAGVLLDGVRVDSSTNLRETQFLTAVGDLCEGLDRFQAMNQELFDEAKGGALLLRRGREAREAISKAEALLDRADRRVEIALQQGREAMAKGQPEPSPITEVTVNLPRTTK